MLQIQNLSKSYLSADAVQQVLTDLEFSMDRASSVALLGESGSGKSTLLHLIAGLEHPDAGTIKFMGQDLHLASESALAALRRSEVSLVFQQFHLIPTLNVLDNLRFQAALCRRLNQDYEIELIERLGLQAQLKKFPHQLSRGQQQRVAIARSLLHKPALVLADEPTGNLDEASSIEVLEVFCDLVRQASTSLLMVTHSRAMANFLDHRVLLHNGQLAAIE